MTEPIKLTDEAIDSLDFACEGNGEYSCCHRGVHRKTGKPVGGEMLDAIEAILTARRAEWMAEAWDEGYTASSLGGFLAPNPYRVEEVGDDE